MMFDHNWVVSNGSLPLSVVAQWKLRQKICPVKLTLLRTEYSRLTYSDRIVRENSGSYFIYWDTNSLQVNSGLLPSSPVFCSCPCSSLFSVVLSLSVLSSACSAVLVLFSVAVVWGVLNIGLWSRTQHPCWQSKYTSNVSLKRTSGPYQGRGKTRIIHSWTRMILQKKFILCKNAENSVCAFIFQFFLGGMMPPDPPSGSRHSDPWSGLVWSVPKVW